MAGHRSGVALQGAVAVVAAPAFIACAWGQCVPQWRGYAGPHLDAPVFALTAWDPDGAGPVAEVVVAGGNFAGAGATWTGQVAMWNGSEWLRMGEGVTGSVLSATSYEQSGSGRQPVIGGIFTHSGATVLNRIARFDGTQWVPFAEGVSDPNPLPTVYSVGTRDDWLLAGGTFTQAGTVPAEGAAFWDGQSWHAFAVNPRGVPYSWATHAGSLYTSGYFIDPGEPTRRTGILRWTGGTWETVGTNYPQWDVFAMAVYQGELHIGGSFSNQCCGSPPAPAEFVARFDGTMWQPLGTGLNGLARAMIVFDADGTGEKLFVGGGFDMAGGIPASGIASWDGAQWRGLGSGTSGRVRALTIWRNQLVAGGEFWSAGGIVSPGMAIWGCEQPGPCYANCDGNTTPPILNVDDFTCFINEFSAGMGLPNGQQVMHYANCDGSTTAPVLNVDDFTCFINAFAQGCR